MTLYVCSCRVEVRKNPDYFHGIEDWCRFRNTNPNLCASFCGTFSRSLACIQLISDRSDVVAVFSSVMWQSPILETVPVKGKFDPSENAFETVIKVVVKATGFVPLQEAPFPAEIDLDGKSLKVVIVEGYSQTCVQRGDAISGSTNQRGFGTMAGIVKKIEQSGASNYYAVICKHAAAEGCKLPDFHPKVDVRFASPPPAYRSYQLMCALKCQVFDSGGRFSNLESHCHYAFNKTQADEIRRYMRYLCKDHTLLSDGDLITLEDIEVFKTHGATVPGYEKQVIHPADKAITVPCNNTSSIKITGDVALVSIEDVQYLHGKMSN